MKIKMDALCAELQETGASGGLSGVRVKIVVPQREFEAIRPELEELAES